MKKFRISVVLSIMLFLFIVLFLIFGKVVKFTIIPKESPDSQNTVTETYASPINIAYLRTLNIQPDPIEIEEELPSGSNYKGYIASYLSEGNKVYGLLTVPLMSAPDGGFPAIVFCHGYTPPAQYVTIDGYVAYVDYLARNGFVVFKIDYRGNGRSEGDPSGSYFSSAYTIDAISALRSLQKYEKVNPQRIGMWGHSMAGNVVLRAMEASDNIKAGVIWSGAVYSYKDFATYGINDTSYTHKPFTTKESTAQKDREISPEIQKIRSDPQSIDFNKPFWTSISLTKNIKYLISPIQIHQATNDPVVNIGYSRDLVQVLKDNGKEYESYEYAGGGHNIVSPYFETAMERTVRFFKDKL
jgi:dipeptidyl aminopeptidase/acylaminoacyl peptidase